MVGASESPPPIGYELEGGMGHGSTSPPLHWPPGLRRVEVLSTPVVGGQTVRDSTPWPFCFPGNLTKKEGYVILCRPQTGGSTLFAITVERWVNRGQPISMVLLSEDARFTAFLTKAEAETLKVQLTKALEE